MMARPTWAEIDAARKALGTMSRAEMCRRAGIAESTVTKGLSNSSRPQKKQRELVLLALAAEQQAIEAGLRETPAEAAE